VPGADSGRARCEPASIWRVVARTTAVSDVTISDHRIARCQGQPGNKQDSRVAQSPGQFQFASKKFGFGAPCIGCLIISSNSCQRRSLWSLDVQVTNNNKIGAINFHCRTWKWIMSCEKAAT
jgi:hypothetical protein